MVFKNISGLFSSDCKHLVSTASMVSLRCVKEISFGFLLLKLISLDKHKASFGLLLFRSFKKGFERKLVAIGDLEREALGGVDLSLIF